MEAYAVSRATIYRVIGRASAATSGSWETVGGLARKLSPTSFVARSRSRARWCSDAAWQWLPTRSGLPRGRRLTRRREQHQEFIVKGFYFGGRRLRMLRSTQKSPPITAMVTTAETTRTTSENPMFIFASLVEVGRHGATVGGNLEVS